MHLCVSVEMQDGSNKNLNLNMQLAEVGYFDFPGGKVLLCLTEGRRNWKALGLLTKLQTVIKRHYCPLKCQKIIHLLHIW